MTVQSPAAKPETSRSAPAPAALKIYNTLSRTKEAFEPLAPGKVGIYLCGPTVYKPSHIGHMVGPIIFDAIKRYLTYCGYQVTWVVNITDVDDKLIAESAARGIAMSALADEMTADYHRNLEAVGVDTIDHFPRATDNIDEIIAITQTLIDKGFAYASEGDVYFDVARDPNYGKLSGRTLQNLIGEGGSTADRKRASSDFALWKSAKEGEVSWKSPWGPGRPGWHIECSAMGRKILGESFDIHGGGLDLIFPHHENEIAQSECCHGKPLAKYWLHNGLMQASSEVGKLGGRATRAADPNKGALLDKPAVAHGIEGDQAAQEAGKMGKSKGAAPFRDLLKTFSGETIRFFLLATHYRSPIDFSEERIAEVGRSLDAFYRFFKRYERVTGGSFYDLNPATNRQAGAFDAAGDATLSEIAGYRERFLEAMDDDFNTGAAVGILFDLLRVLNKFTDQTSLETKRDEGNLKTFRTASAALRELTATLGLFRAPVAEAKSGDDELAQNLMKLFIELRQEARASKNFALADRIRAGLGAMGITIEDRATGAEWSIQR